MDIINNDWINCQSGGYSSQIIVEAVRIPINASNPLFLIIIDTLSISVGQMAPDKWLILI